MACTVSCSITITSDAEEVAEETTGGGEVTLERFSDGEEDHTMQYTYFHEVLQKEAALMAGIVNCFDCYPAGGAPWESMPPGGQRRQPIGKIALPAVEGVETDVLVFDVPIGFDAVFVTLVCMFTGTGFVDSSGDIVYRIKQGRRYVPDYGAVEEQLGDLSTPYAMEGAGIRAISGQRITITATLGTGALGRLSANNIVGALNGWIYPRR